MDRRNRLFSLGPSDSTSWGPVNVGTTDGVGADEGASGEAPRIGTIRDAVQLSSTELLLATDTGLWTATRGPDDLMAVRSPLNPLLPTAPTQRMAIDNGKVWLLGELGLFLQDSDALTQVPGVTAPGPFHLLAPSSVKNTGGNGDGLNAGTASVTQDCKFCKSWSATP